LQEVSTTLGVTVTESAICKVLKKDGFTYQKLAVYAIQQDEALRQQFKADVSMYRKEEIVFIDETGRHHTYSWLQHEREIIKSTEVCGEGGTCIYHCCHINARNY